jgi:hypothetical protein
VHGISIYSGIRTVEIISIDYLVGAFSDLLDRKELSFGLVGYSKTSLPTIENCWCAGNEHVWNIFLYSLFAFLSFSVTKVDSNPKSGPIAVWRFKKERHAGCPGWAFFQRHGVLPLNQKHLATLHHAGVVSRKDQSHRTIDRP